jgi:hypothetical protein
MIFGSYSPIQFLGFDALLETLFMLITLVIAWYAWRIDRYAAGKQYRWWSLGFLLISAAYLFSAVTNFLLYEELYEGLPVLLPWMAMLHLGGQFLHHLFFLCGFALLLVLVVHVQRVGGAILLLFSLIFLITIGSVVFTFLPSLTAVLLLAFIIHALLTHPDHRRTLTSTLVVAGFSGILLGELVFLFIPWFGISYIIGHLLELAGFGLLFVSMAVILRT